MSNYLNSEYVKVFPAADRGNDYKLAALTTENNLTSFIRSIYPRNNGSFVINKNSFTSPFDFVIRGYYFSLTNISSLNSSKPIYATACISDNDDSLVSGYKKLVRYDGSQEETLLDSGSTFYGLYFTEDGNVEAPAGSTAYTIKLWDGSKVPEESRFYLDTSEIRNGNSETESLSQKLNTQTIVTSGDETVGGKLTVNGNTELKGMLNASGLTSYNSGTTTTDNSPSLVNHNNDVAKVDLSSQDATATDEPNDTTSITYVDSIIQKANGRIVRTRKTTTISSGSAIQGAFGFNSGTDNISVYGLSTSDSPTFSSLSLSELDANKAIVTDEQRKLISRDISDRSSAMHLQNKTNFVTERTIYNGLPTINNSHTYNCSTILYTMTSSGTAGGVVYAKGGTDAPTSTAAGTAGQLLKSNGSNAPTWISQSSISAGSADKLNNTTVVGGQYKPVYFTSAGIPQVVTGISHEILPYANSSEKGAVRINYSNNVLYIYTE